MPKHAEIIFKKNAKKTGKTIRSTQFADKGYCSFKDILQLWQDSNRIRLKKSTVSRYQNLIDTHIVPELGELDVRTLTAPQINSFLFEKLSSGRTDGKGGLSPAYVRSIMQIISSALKFAAAEQLCMPLCSAINKPVIQKKELTVLSEFHQHQLEQELLREIDGTKMGILISLYTGLRIGEVCALMWEDVDLENRVIYVRHTVARVWHTAGGKKVSEFIIDTPKTKSSIRKVPICSKLFSAILSYPKRTSAGYVMTSNSTFVSPRTFEYRYCSVLKHSGVPHTNYHTLRHTFATRCVEADVDIKSLSEILGHASVSITLNTYVHSSFEFKRRQLEKIV